MYAAPRAVVLMRGYVKKEAGAMMLDAALTERLEQLSRALPAAPPEPAPPAGPEAEPLVDCRLHCRSAYLPPRAGDCMEMLVVCRGTLTALIEGREEPLEEGDILLTSPRTSHGVLPAPPDCLAVNLHVSPYFFDLTKDIFHSTTELSEFLSNILRKNPLRGQFLLFKVPDHRPIHRLLDVLLMNFFLHPEQAAHPWSPQDRDRISGACLSSILFYLNKEVEPALCEIPLDESHTLKRTVLAYIQANYRDATLRELSRLTNCSESTLSRNIQKLTGHSFSQLLQQCRFDKARELLETTILPIADIAAAVGYECYSFFYRRFRELYGCTPSQFRRRYNTKKP